MKTKLQNMDKTKREKLINAAIDEFSKYPFEKASTNNIVKNAGISKGLLFHYFKDKQELYDMTAEFVIKKLFNDIERNIDWDETDLFARIKQLVMVKIEIGLKYPGLYDFVITLVTGSRGNVDVGYVKNYYLRCGVNIEKVTSEILSKNIDYSKFKDQTMIGKYIEIIQWTLEGIGKKTIAEKTDCMSDYLINIQIEIDKYIDVLKKAFYKNDKGE